MAHQQNDLIYIEPQSAFQVFTEPNAILPYIEKIRDQVKDYVADLSTPAGRDECRTLAFKLVKSRTYLEGIGKELADQAKLTPKLIDATRKTAREQIDAIAEEVRRPLTEWEAAEKARVDRHAAAILKIEETGRTAGSVQELRAALCFVESVETAPEACDEYADEYDRAKRSAGGKLVDALVEAEKREAEQAELAQLRKEREDRIAREQQEAAAVAERERQAEAIRQAEQRERERAERAAETERANAAAREQRLREEAEEAERRAERAVEEERKRLAAEKAQEEADAKRRENNRKHAAKVNGEAAAAIVAVLSTLHDSASSEETAKAIVIAIARQEIPRVSVAY